MTLSSTITVIYKRQASCFMDLGSRSSAQMSECFIILFFLSRNSFSTSHPLKPQVVNFTYCLCMDLKKTFRGVGRCISLFPPTSSIYAKLG